MTNRDQDVTLDEMAYCISFWMDDWEIVHTEQCTGHWNGKPQWTRKRIPVRPIVDEPDENEPEHWKDVMPEIFESLDVIREVELALDEIGESTKYEFWIDQILEEQGKILSVADIHGIDYLIADSKTRLQAIYATLRESGEI